MFMRTATQPNAPLHRSRLRAERRFVWAGRAALGTALLMLCILLGTLAWNGLPGFIQVQVRIPVTFDASMLGAAEGKPVSEMPVSGFMGLAPQGLQKMFPDVKDPDDQRELAKLLSSSTAVNLRRQLAAHPAWLGNAAYTQYVWVPVSSPVARAVKAGAPPPNTPLSAKQQQWLQTLMAQDAVRVQFDSDFFRHGDSRQPEEAGFLGAIIGSLLSVLVCLGVAFPLGVMTAVYLEEFAPRGKLVELIEVNINNLAAVPSIVFGLLGLAVYLNVMGLPRSAPLVGGLTLALMILPVIIISTRSALSAVPDSIRQGALALGASPLQAVWRNTLPLALPGIMTGTILGLARAIGETAPLLMIGMVAFVADVPHGFTDPATTMPVQVYLWASSPEAGFTEKTAAGILLLLLVLLALNALAIYIRKRFEVRW